MKSRTLGLLLALLLVGPTVAHADLITNGGFELGNLTGWTCSGADLCQTTTNAPRSGSYAFWGYDNSGFATLSQTFATSAGESLYFSFYSQTSVPALNGLRYQFDAAPLVIVPSTSSYALTSDVWVASGPTTTISFYFDTDYGSGVWWIDDVSVVGTAVPEPASLLLLGTGLAGLVRVARRRRQ